MSFQPTKKQKELIDSAIDDVQALIEKYKEKGENISSKLDHKMYMINLICNLISQLLISLFYNIKQEHWDETIQKMKEVSIREMEKEIKENLMEKFN